MGTKENKLRPLRERAGLTQQQMAELMGLAGWENYSRENITRYEQGIGLKFVDAIRYAQCCNADLDEMAVLLYPDMVYSKTHGEQMYMDENKEEYVITKPEEELYKSIADSSNNGVLEVEGEDGEKESYTIKVLNASDAKEKACRIIIPDIVRRLNETRKMHSNHYIHIGGPTDRLPCMIFFARIKAALKNDECVFIVDNGDYKEEIEEIENLANERGHKIVEISKMDDISLRDWIRGEDGARILSEILLRFRADIDADYYAHAVATLLTRAIKDATALDSEESFIQLLLKVLEDEKIVKEALGVASKDKKEVQEAYLTTFPLMGRNDDAKKIMCDELLTNKHLIIVKDDMFGHNPLSVILVSEYIQMCMDYADINYHEKPLGRNIFMLNVMPILNKLSADQIHRVIATGYSRNIKLNMTAYCMEVLDDAFLDKAEKIKEYSNIGISTRYLTSLETISYVNDRLPEDKKVIEKKKKKFNMTDALFSKAMQLSGETDYMLKESGREKFENIMVLGPARGSTKDSQ